MKAEEQPDAIDWRLTTWEGARRAELRRWAALPLERDVLALEEMEELAQWFSQAPPAPRRRIRAARTDPPDHLPAESPARTSPT